MANDIELEANGNKGEHPHSNPLPGNRQAAVADLLAVEEDNERGNDEDHVLQEGRLVRHLNDVAEAAAVLHHTEVVDTIHLQILRNGKPQREEEEKGHKDKISPSR